MTKSLWIRAAKDAIERGRKVRGNSLAKGLSATQRTLRHLRAQGLVVAIVERWNAYAGPAGIRQDLFGIIDILALDPASGVMGIQSTTGAQMPAHRQKLCVDCAQASRDWLETPGTSLWLYGWRKIKKRKTDGTWGAARYWEPRIEELTLEDLG